MPKEPEAMRKLKNAVAITSIIAIVAVVTALVAINPMDNAQAQTSNGICGRDATVQTAIMASIADVNLCADVTNQHLAAITGALDLSDNSLTALAASDLEGLSGLTALDISDNDIEYLPSHVFDDLTALEEIDLSGNGLMLMPPDPFHKNLSLEIMDASDNEISSLQEGIFINNGALVKVDFSDNDINYLSGTEFTSSPLLTRIDLANNALPGLSMDMFQGLASLEELYLAGNTGAPFSIDVKALDLGANSFEVGIGGGAPPFDMSATVSATGGTLSHSAVTFAGGGRGMSKVITVTHSGDGPATVTVSDAAFTEGTYSGITTTNGANLSVSQNGAARGICSRTRQIQDAILDLLGGVPCGTVSATDLAGITKPLAVVGTSMSTLREGDLANLTGVRDLYLYGNEINELPAGFFKDAGSFDRVLIQDNPGAPFQLAVTLTERPSGSYVVQMRESTPFRVDVALKATGATLYPRMTDIYGGETQSIETTVTADGSGETVKVEIDQVSFRDWGLTGYSYYDGFELAIATETTSAPATAADTAGVTGQAETPTPEPPAPAPTAAPAVVVVPSAPINLTATTSGGSITISWTVPAEGAVTGYQILRRRPTEGERRLTVHVENTGNTDTSYTDDSVTSGVRHVYRVKAINSAGAGPQSNYVRVTP